MAFTDGFVRPDSLAATADGYRVRLQMPWMRSLPLSCVVDLAISLDGVSAPRDALRLDIDGSHVPLADLADLVDDVWFIQRRIDAVVPSEVRVVPGETYTVAASARLRIPYIAGPMGPMTLEPRVEYDLVAQPA